MVIDLSDSEDQIEDSEKKPTKPVKVTKKRQRDDTDDDEKRSLLHVARGVCSSAQEWQSIRKYKVKQLRDWVEMRQFERDRAVGEGMIGRGVEVLGHVIDKVTRGGGYVASEIQHDTALAECVQSELGDLIKYLNNRVKIVFLLFNDICAGLAKKPKTNDETPHIEIEEKSEDVDSQTSTENNALSAAGQLYPEFFARGEETETENESEVPGGDLAGETGSIPLVTV